MGISSVSCVFSGLTLYNEEAVFIPLRRQRLTKLAGARLIAPDSDSGATALFEPLSLPVYVKTDEYGQFETICEDVNTVVMERHFGLPIAKFLDCCWTGRETNIPPYIAEKGVKFVSIEPAGCFVSREIYDRFSRPASGGAWDGSVWSDLNIFEFHLEAIGCLNMGRKIFRHPQIPGVLFACEHGSVRLMVVSKDGSLREVDGLHYCGSLYELHAELLDSQFLGFPLPDIDRVKAQNALLQKMRWERDKIARSLADLDAMTRAGTLPAAWDFGFTPLSQGHRSRYLGLLTGFERLFNRYWEASWSNPECDNLEEVAKMIEFIRSMNSANRVLMPTPTNLQLPNHDESLVIADFVAGLALRRTLGSGDSD